MDRHNEFNSEPHLLKELHTLFEEVTPTQLRHTVEDIFFQYQAEDYVALTRDQVKDVHLLVKFLREVERLHKA